MRHIEIQQIQQSIAVWASQYPLIKRVSIFGSRVRGDHRHDSDLDVAIELDPAEYESSDESGGWATWMFETSEWKNELQALIPYEIHLEQYCGDQTPTIRDGLKRSSKLVYEKE